MSQSQPREARGDRARPGEEEPVGELGGQHQLGRRRLPADQVGDSAEAEDSVAMVLDEPFALLSLSFSLVASGMVHRAPQLRSDRPSRRSQP